MTTASARTNQSGHTVSGMGSLGEVMNKTAHFVVATSADSKGVFPPESKVRNYMGDGAFVIELGKLLSSSNNKLQLIGQAVFESGANLRDRVEIVELDVEKRGQELEVWTECVRYKEMTGRVYGHKRSK